MKNLNLNKVTLHYNFLEYSSAKYISCIEYKQHVTLFQHAPIDYIQLVIRTRQQVVLLENYLPNRLLDIRYKASVIGKNIDSFNPVIQHYSSKKKVRKKKTI